ncbi:MAG: DUF503 domain-containing protein [Thermoleophilia bacterium]
MGILAVELHFPEGGSLKDKRRHLRSIKAGISRKLGAAIAEIGFHDLWQRTRLLVSVCSGSAHEAERSLDLAISYLEARDYMVSGIHREIIKVEGD